MSKQKLLTREQKAWQIYEAGLVMKQTDDIYWVQSQKDNTKGYQVIFPLRQCECLDFLQNRNKEPCKHWLAIQILRMKEFENIANEIIHSEVKAFGKVIASTANESMIERDKKRKYKIGVIQ